MATLVAVISDTHGILRPQVTEYLKKCDVIIHAGDFDDQETLDSIAEYAPLYAVRGNNDWDLSLPAVLRFKVEELNFVMVHNRIAMPALQGADVAVFGHSHRYYCGTDDGVLWLNPGSCGRRRFGLELSFAMMHIDGKKYSVDKISLSVPR
jgi:putative phosphoesterase